MNTTDLQNLQEFCQTLHSTPDWEIVAKCMEKEEIDFQVNSVRFIRATNIEEIMCEELRSDEYVLGCFNVDTLAEATGWPEFLIAAAQTGGQYEAIGQALTKNQIGQLTRIYVGADGYGHHFNCHDFSQEEIKINGVDYYVFDMH